MKYKQIKEGLGDAAHRAELDHEVQMARADLYKLAKYSIKLHELLKNISEAEGLEGWVQAKITKASDYISSVYHYMDYDEKFDQAETADNVEIVPTQKVVPTVAKTETYEEVLFKILDKKVTEKKSNSTEEK
jgi:hypothetical protein